MSAPTMKEMCERATLPDSRQSMAASQEIDRRLSPATVLRVVEALEKMTSRVDAWKRGIAESVEILAVNNELKDTLRLLDGREENLP